MVVLTCQLDLLTYQTKFLVKIISSPFRFKNFKKSTNYFMETLAMGLQQTGFNWKRQRRSVLVTLKFRKIPMKLWYLTLYRRSPYSFSFVRLMILLIVKKRITAWICLSSTHRFTVHKVCKWAVAFQTTQDKTQTTVSDILSKTSSCDKCNGQKKTYKITTKCCAIREAID